MWFVTQDNIVRVPWDRVQDILCLVSWFQKKLLSQQECFSVITGETDYVCSICGIRQATSSPSPDGTFRTAEHKIFVTEQVKHHLGWWLDRDRFIRGVVLKQSPPTHTVFTDELFWLGCSFGTGRTHVSWSLATEPISTSYQHSRNEGYSFSPQRVSAHSVQFLSNDSDRQFFGQREGGTHSPTLCMEVRETLLSCHENEISLRVRHIPGRTNILADRLSRSRNRKLRASSPKSPNAFSSRLDIVKRLVTDRNCSQNIAEHVSKGRRSSTRKVYEEKMERI